MVMPFVRTSRTNMQAPIFRTSRADIVRHICDNSHMARRGIPKGPVNWYLPEWMAACGLQGRGAQTKMRELTGWSKATMHQLYHGDQDYSPAVVNAAAFALKAEPYELLMPPEKAFMIRRALASIKEIKTLDDDSVPVLAEPLIRKIRT